jgi:hypothetical protein
MDTKLQLVIVVALGIAVVLAAGILLHRMNTSTPPVVEPTAAPAETTFTIRIENIAASDAITTSDGGTATFALSPLGWAVHAPSTPIFTDGASASGTPLERLAEDGNPVPLVGELASMGGIDSSGVVDTPVGASSPGILTPGESFEFQVTAAPGMWLSFVTMFGQSNDLFYAPQPPGIALFDADGNPMSGDVTWLIHLWDAGTEVNQEPGLGSDQAPRQAAPNTGEDENGVIHPVNDGFTYPNTADVLRVTITPAT